MVQAHCGTQNEIRNPSAIISNVYVHQTAELEVNEYIGIGFATISNGSTRVMLALVRDGSCHEPGIEQCDRGHCYQRYKEYRHYPQHANQ